MQKLTVLIALFVGACAVDPETTSTDPTTDGTVSATSTVPGTNSNCQPSLLCCDCPPPETGPTCTTKQEGVVDLDSLPANTDHEDGRVSFCHATGSSSNPYILLTTDVSGCVNGHADHEPGGNDDIFATQGCDD